METNVQLKQLLLYLEFASWKKNSNCESYDSCMTNCF